MANVTMAELGRAACEAIADVTEINFIHHYVNKTPKYVSIKVNSRHLTPEQLNTVTEVLSSKYPDRFLKVYNSTSTRCMPIIHGTTTWKEEKVNVRFTQL